MQLVKQLVDYTRYAIIVAFALAFIGVQRQTTQEAAIKLESFYKLTVGIVLVLFANPYADLPKQFLKQLAFSAGLLIVASSGLTALILTKLHPTTSISLAPGSILPSTTNASSSSHSDT